MAQKSADQDRNIFFSFAQRRHHNAHHVETKIKVVAEFSLAHELFPDFCLSPRSGAHRHASLVSADALERAFFAHHRSNFTCVLGVISADFIEENRAAIGLLEPADAAFVRAGERALLVSEQFAFESFGESAAQWTTTNFALLRRLRL